MKKDNQTESKITVYFDGLCHLCSREINQYRKMRGAERIEFLDITSPRFDAVREGVDPKEVHRHLHVKDRDGSFKVGVDAFIAIWRELPALKALSRLASKNPIHKTIDIAYGLFAKIRPLLPRKNCVDSPYCEIKHSR